MQLRKNRHSFQVDNIFAFEPFSCTKRDGKLTFLFDMLYLTIASGDSHFFPSHFETSYKSHFIGYRGLDFWFAVNYLRRLKHIINDSYNMMWIGKKNVFYNHKRCLNCHWICTFSLKKKKKTAVFYYTYYANHINHIIKRKFYSFM